MATRRASDRFTGLSSKQLATDILAFPVTRSTDETRPPKKEETFEFYLDDRVANIEADLHATEVLPPLFPLAGKSPEEALTARIIECSELARGLDALRTRHKLSPLQRQVFQRGLSLLELFAKESEEFARLDREDMRRVGTIDEDPMHYIGRSFGAHVHGESPDTADNILRHKRRLSNDAKETEIFVANIRKEIIPRFRALAEKLHITLDEGLAR